MDRRQFLRHLATATGASLVTDLRVTQASAAPPAGFEFPLGSGLSDSITAAYRYISFAMDAYQQGSTTRIIQTYSDNANLGSSAFVADTALAIIAYLERSTRDDLTRAALLGDSLLYAQNNDPTYADGRLRDAYWVGPFDLSGASNDSYFVRADGSVNLVGAPWFFQASTVGGLAWVGIALAKLYRRTRLVRYLMGAQLLGQWIVNNAYDTFGLGGYVFGVDAKNQRVSNIKSGEHNILVYALMINFLYPLTGTPSWKASGEHALQYIKKLWNPSGGYFYVGSDASTTNTASVSENVQSYSYLSLLSSQYASALDWVKTSLATIDTPQSLHSALTGNVRFAGVSFTTASRGAAEAASPSDPPADPDAVWLEGTAHMAAALLARRLSPSRDLPTFYGDVATASDYLNQIKFVQSQVGAAQEVNQRVSPTGAGLVTTTSPLNTGFGYSFLPVLQISPTAWYPIAAAGCNPLRM